MASNQSKTARASVRAGQSGSAGVSVLGEFKFLIPLNKGRHAYVRNLVTGQTVRTATDSERFVEEIRQLTGAGHGAKLRVELDTLNEAHPDHGWAEALKRLDEAGALAADAS